MLPAWLVSLVLVEGRDLGNLPGAWCHLVSTYGPGEQGGKGGGKGKRAG